MLATIEKGKRIPNWSVQDREKEDHTLWDYRQKTHVVLVYEPEADAQTHERWTSAIRADRKQWEWLNVYFLFAKKGPSEMAPGTYLIDRFGMLQNYYAPGTWTFETLERDWIYYEARHC